MNRHAFTAYYDIVGGRMKVVGSHCMGCGLRVRGFCTPHYVGLCTAP